MEEKDVANGVVVKWTKTPGGEDTNERPWVLLSLAGSENWEGYLRYEEPSEETLEYGLFGASSYLHETNNDWFNWRSYGKSLGALYKENLPYLRVVGNISEMSAEEWDQLHGE